MAHRIVIGCIIVVWLAACSSAPEVVETEIFTPEPTIVPTLAPVGFPSNPLQFRVVPANPDVAEDFEAELETILLQSTNVSFDVIIVDRQAEAVQGICDSFGLEEGMAVGWVDVVAYAALFEQRCGAATIQLARDGAIGEAGVWLANDNFAGSSVEVLSQRPVCRLGLDDFYSWVLVSLALYSEGFNPADVEVIEYDNADDMLQAIDDGACASGMVAQSTWEAWDADNNNRLDEIMTTLDMPYGILVLPFAAPESARLAITSGLSEFDAEIIAEGVSTGGQGDETPAVDATADVTEAAGFDMAQVMAAFFGEGTFAAVQTGDFDEALAFLRETGIQLTTIGN